MPSKTIVFIHGLFMTSRCWEGWVQRFQSRGYACHTIAYPGRDRSAADLRATHPDPRVAELTFDAVLEHCQKAVTALPEAPIIIGHSLGGLLTQILLNRGLGAGAVTISSGPPQGILSTKLSFLRSNWAALNPLNSSAKPYLMPFETFQYAFVNGQPLTEQRAIYDAQVPPESLRIPRGVLSSPNARVDFSKAHAPLLMIAGGQDHIIPASLVETNFKRYKTPNVDWHVIADRNHYGFAQPGWEAMADYAAQWIQRRGL